MTVSHQQPSPQPSPSGRDMRIIAGIVAAGLAVIAIIVVIIASSGGGDSDREDAYISDVRDELSARIGGDTEFMEDTTRQDFIDAGYAMCDVIDVDTAAAESRMVLIEHGLGDYANQWVWISGAAADNLC